jgi:hypothetical protein
VFGAADHKEDPSVKVKTHMKTQDSLTKRVEAEGQTPKQLVGGHYLTGS